MTALAAAPTIVADPHSRWRPMAEWPHGEQTLDDLVAGAWEELAVRGLARCPVCGGEMLADVTPAPGGDAAGAADLDDADEPLHAILSGVCQDCGTELD